MFPVGLAGKDLIPLEPTETAEKFWRRSVDDIAATSQGTLGLIRTNVELSADGFCSNEISFF